jgi:nitrite reductase/ring-hydroxylating ferredoxin subunit
VNDPVLTRRRALAGAAVGGLTLPVLAACGGGGPSGGTAQDTGGTGGTGSNGGKDQGGGSAATLVPTANVPVGGGVILASQNVVVTQPKKGTFEGFSATCTHQGCILASVASGTINCGCHGSQFSITDGSNVAGPMGSPAGSVAPLPRVPVKVKGPNVVQG